uniref:DUF4391 domain-containing protein n=1 Tax=Variovorax paradoxus (strain S110) TaxID=543728 RepID=C5CL49_VARPS
MTLEALIAALALPASCRVDQRVPKKVLIENGAPTAGDKRLLNDGIEEIQWIAALKPNTVGVPDYRDEEREYLEVAVLSITTRGTPEETANGTATVAATSVNTTRLAELVHRAVPYPVLLLLDTPQGVFLSMAHKRWAQNEAGKVVLDGDVTTVAITSEVQDVSPFVQSMALVRQSQATLMELYQGWMDCLTALHASRYTGVYTALNDPEQAARRRAALRDYQRLEREATRLRTQATKEKQMAKQVELNLALKRVQTGLLAARQQLEGNR